MHHLLQMVVDFVRELGLLITYLPSLLAHAMCGLLQSLIGRMKPAVVMVKTGMNPLNAHFGVQPTLLVPALGLVGFVLLLKYSQERKVSEQGDLILSILVVAVGLVLTSLLGG